MAKCPKCQYFSFDSGDRCRNCGYEFSLSRDPQDDELPIQNADDPIGPMADLSLNEPAKLPLFPGGGDPDAPLVTPAAAPRPPLAVRRGAPATGRPARGRRDRAVPDPEPRLALDTAEFPIVPPKPPAVPAESLHQPDAPLAPAAAETAGRGARIVAGAIDLALLLGIDFVVLYFTLKILDLTYIEAFTLPPAPFFSFLLILNGGYLSAFVAAGGQTIGKMAAGIRVIPADPAAPPTERVTFGHAAVRAAGYVVSALPLGLGFLPAFLGRERRALHDRLADTRVVKA